MNGDAVVEVDRIPHSAERAFAYPLHSAINGEDATWRV